MVVAGDLKQGTSQLIDTLVNAPVCPVDDDAGTSVPTVVRHGDPPSAALVLPEAESGSLGEGEPQRRQVRIDDLATYLSETGDRRRLLGAEVCLPRQVLAGGLTIVDSPGIGGGSPTHLLETLAVLSTADALLLVPDALQEYTEPEIGFLRQALQVAPQVACARTKTDVYPQWREVARLDRRHSDQIDSGIPLIPVSVRQPCQPRWPRTTSRWGMDQHNSLSPHEPRRPRTGGGGGRFPAAVCRRGVGFARGWRGVYCFSSRCC